MSFLLCFGIFLEAKAKVDNCDSVNILCGDHKRLNNEQKAILEIKTFKMRPKAWKTDKFSRKFETTPYIVEIVSSASPFGCVLRDQNWRDRINRNTRENCNKVESSFQTKIKFFVQDHRIHATIPDSTPLVNHEDAGEFLVNQKTNTIGDETMQNGRKKGGISPKPTDDCSTKPINLGCVSSLVQRWREFSDIRHMAKNTDNLNASLSSPAPNADSTTAFGKSNNCHANLSSVYEETTSDSMNENFDTPYSERFETPSTTMVDDTFLDWDSERAVQMGTPFAQSRNSEDSGEKEKLKVADVIKKLKLEKMSMGNGTENRMKEQDKSGFTPMISSPPRIRGRKAFHDLLMQLERDRHMELDKLVERRTVSKFPHRGRIQSNLRLKFIRRDAVLRHDHHQQQHSKINVPRPHSRSTPSLLPQQPSTCEKSAIVDDPQISSSSPIEIETQKSEPLLKKQMQSILKIIVEQNPRCEAANINGQQSESVSSEHNRVGKSSTVVLLREKFNELDKTDATPKTPNPKTPSLKTPRLAKSYVKSSSTSNQHREELHQQQEVVNLARTSCSSQNSVLQETEEISIPSSDLLQQERNYEVDNTCSLESVKLSTKSNGWELRNNLEHNEINPACLREANYEVHNQCSLESEKILRMSSRSEIGNNLEEHDLIKSASLQIASSLDSDVTSKISKGWELRNSIEKQHQSNSDSLFPQEANHEVGNICSAEPGNNLEEHEKSKSVSLRIVFSLDSDETSKVSEDWEVRNNMEKHHQSNSDSLLPQDANHEVNNICTAEPGKTMKLSNGWEYSKNVKEDDQNNQESHDHQIFQSCEEWTTNGIHSWSECEWYEEDFSNHNWVSDIARPKSDWENLRQARYRDMLDSDNKNDDMRRLLERRSVSTFLTSDLRDAMDQLMMSRVERVPQSMEDHHDHRLEQFVPKQTITRKEVDEKEGGDSNFSDEVRYPSLGQPLLSQTSFPDTLAFSALTNRSSIDTENMYDLRAYMEQLHQEVSELRKAVNICMNTQEKVIKQEVAAAVDLAVAKAMQESAKNTARTRTCCLCYEMQVDALLYRCGHMCTCFNCAQELQWRTGKCPICRAQIDDVVRTYPLNISINPR